MSVGRLAARAVIGGLFIGHGTQKLFGWFGGPGRTGTEGMMEPLQLRPAKLHATLAGVTETPAVPCWRPPDRCDDHGDQQGPPAQRALGG